MPFTTYAHLTNSVSRSTIADGDLLDNIFFELSGRDGEVSAAFDDLEESLPQYNNLLPSNYDYLWNTEHIRNFNNTLLTEAGETVDTILGAKRTAKTLAFGTNDTLEFVKNSSNEYSLQTKEAKPIKSYYEANKYLRKADTKLSLEETFTYSTRESIIGDSSFIYGGVYTDSNDGIVIAAPVSYFDEQDFLTAYSKFSCGAQSREVTLLDNVTTKTIFTRTSAVDNSILLDFAKHGATNAYSENNSIALYSETSANDHSIAIKGAIAGTSAIAMFGKYTYSMGCTFGFPTSAYNRSISFGIGYSDNNSLLLQPTILNTNASAIDSSISIADESYNLSHSSISVYGFTRGGYISDVKPVYNDLDSKRSIFECNHDSTNTEHKNISAYDSCVMNSEFFKLNLSANSSIVAASRFYPHVGTDYEGLTVADTNMCTINMNNTIAMGVKGMAVKSYSNKPNDGAFAEFENSVFLGGWCIPAKVKNSIVLANGFGNGLISSTAVSDDTIDNALMFAVKTDNTNYSRYSNALSFGRYISLCVYSADEGISDVTIGINQYNTRKNVVKIGQYCNNVSAAKNSFLLSQRNISDTSVENKNLFVIGQNEDYSVKAKSNCIIHGAFNNVVAGNNTMFMYISSADNVNVDNSFAFSNGKLTTKANNNLVMFSSNNNGKLRSLSMFNTTASKDDEIAFWNGTFDAANLSKKKMVTVNTLPDLSEIQSNVIYILRG